MRAGALGGLSALLVAGCFAPSYQDGALTCAQPNLCPDGYHCATDNKCWSNGHDPDAAPPPPPSDGGASDGAGAQDHPGGQANKDTEGQADDAGVELDALAAAYANAVCGINSSCCHELDETACEKSVQSEFQYVVNAIQDGLAASRTVYDSQSASTCLQSIAAITCSDWKSLSNTSELAWLKALPGCSLAITPQGAVDDTCASAVECTTWLCGPEKKCRTRASSGLTCVQMAEQNYCVDGDYCDSTGLTCTPTKSPGASCSADDECESQSCGAGANDAGRVCESPVCASNGPLLPPSSGCALGGRPSALALVLVSVALACSTGRSLRRRRRAAKDK
ncbi:MAG: hypothetical protein ABSB49_10100 [Polyangia bacterium]|jgi:hypothetical protein